MSRKSLWCHFNYSLHFTSLYCILSFGKSYSTSSGSACALSCTKSALMCHDSLLEMHQSICGIIVVAAHPIAPLNLSFLWQQCQVLSDVLRSRLWWSGSCHGRCRWTLASPEAQKMLAQSVTCSDGKMCRCFIMLQPYMYIISMLLSCNIKYTFTISAYDAAYIDPSKNWG